VGRGWKCILQSGSCAQEPVGENLQDCEEMHAQAGAQVCVRPGHGSCLIPVPALPWQSSPWLLPRTSCSRSPHPNPVALLSLCFPRQLMENQIGAVERGAFDDMKELERL
jgi:hypothetical protein